MKRLHRDFVLIYGNVTQKINKARQVKEGSRTKSFRLKLLIPGKVVTFITGKLCHNSLSPEINLQNIAG